MFFSFLDHILKAWDVSFMINLEPTDRINFDASIFKHSFVHADWCLK